MKVNSTKIARAFGLVMIVLVAGWDVDAMRPHLAAHSWYTLFLVGLFFTAHIGDYLTVGRLIHRFDPLLFANLEEFTAPALFLVEDRNPGSTGFAPAAARFSLPLALRAGWQRLFAYQQPVSLVPHQATAKLYAFTITEPEAAQAVGAPAALRPHYNVIPVE